MTLAPDHTYRLGIRTLVALFAGRGSFRLTQLAANVALLPLWGEQRYGVYAAAVATFSWVIALLQSGPEKAILKLLPRAPLSGPLISRAMVALLWGLPLPVLVAFVAVAVLAPDSAAAVYVGVAAMAVGSGSLLLLAGMHRVHRRPEYDSRSAVAMAVAQLVLLGLVVLGLGPLGYLLIYVCWQTAVNLVLLVRLGRPSLQIRRRSGFLRRVVWTTLFMGSPEVCLYLVTSVVFSLLAASRWSGQVSLLFAVTLVWSAGITFLMYGMRVFAPHTSRRLLGNSAYGRAVAARLSMWAVGYNVCWLVAIWIVLQHTAIQQAAVGGAALWVWVGLLASRTPSDVLLLLAGYLLENSDARSTRITGGVALLDLAAAALSAAFLIPALGGVGLVTSVMIGALVQGLLYAVLARKRNAESRRSSVREGAR